MIFKLSVFEWIVIIAVVDFVLLAKAVNSTIENLSVFIMPEQNSTIKKIKDISASKVLISVIVAFAIGLLISIPRAGC
jgi:diacylglycerol kinase